jgi:hypothetical protein
MRKLGRFASFVFLLTTSASGATDVDLYDAKGVAVAFVNSDGIEWTFYSWTDGVPTAYLDEDSIYGFNGKHLGWFERGTVFDHDGNVVMAVAARFKDGVQTPPPKSPKQYKPYKDYKEYRPYKPVYNNTWSKTAARSFLEQGKK